LVPSARTGTDDAIGEMPTMQNQAEAGFDNKYDPPAVWRSPRANQAASQVKNLEDNGVERFDIPAFLRRQAD